MSRAYRIRLRDVKPQEQDMSRAYRITVKESETRHLKAGDEISTQLEILEILPPEDMATLLKEELKKRGFAEQDDGTMARKDGDVTVKVDPCTGEVSVKAEAAETVNQEARRDATGFNDVGPGEHSLRDRVKEQLKQDLEKKFDQEQNRLQTKATEQFGEAPAGDPAGDFAGGQPGHPRRAEAEGPADGHGQGDQRGRRERVADDQGRSVIPGIRRQKMPIRVGARFYAVHSNRGVECGTIMGVSQPGEFLYPWVQVRFDGQAAVQYLSPRCMRIIG